MRLKPLVSIMALLPVVFLPTSTALFASDLTIYSGNQKGKTKILLMLDTSGSMGISSLVLPKDNQYGSPGDVPEPICEAKNIDGYDEWIYNLKDPATGKTAFAKSVTIGGETITYYMRGCTKNINGTTVQQWDRISRLKDAIIPLLAGTKIEDNVEMGLGQFSSKTDITIGKGESTLKLVDGHSGKVAVAAAALSVDQRKKLIKAIAAIQSTDPATDQAGNSSTLYQKQSITPLNIHRISGSTPTAHAYAEMGAYMLGTTTVASTATMPSNLRWVYDGSAIYRYDNKSQQTYWVCVELKSGLSEALGYSSAEKNVKQCDSPWPNDNVGGTFFGKLSDTLQKGGNFKPKIFNADDDILENYSSEKVNGVLREYYTGSPLQEKNFTLTKDKIWEMVYNLPYGYRIGGWKKVPNEPMDIEPLSAKSWGQGVGKVLAIYRTNPFSLNERQGLTDYDDNLDGGLLYSDSASKPTPTAKTYNQFGSASSCDGNGIYFLTDGAPNSTKVTMAEEIMNRSLTGSTAISCPIDGGLKSPSLLKSSMFAGETGRWECIGEYAKRLRIRDQNPKSMEIKTAVVGFGASFEGLNVTLDADGNNVYDCNTAGASDDAKNACKWGSKDHDYGKGGFYQATNSDEIANSIIKFVNEIEPKFTSSSLGSISVPRDPLDQTKYMTQGFFPMIQPAVNTTSRTWIGNLKKYNISGGTLKDSSGNAIYKIENSQQVINVDAKDLWSEAVTGTDHSVVSSGGAWNKIPVPSTAQEAIDMINNVNSQRKVYIADGSSLKQVTKENLATDFSGTVALPATLTVNQRLALLNYLGYPTTFPTTQTTLTTDQITPLAVNPDIPYRYLGGVVHSTPLMVTKSSTISTNNIATAREEYTVYGSMDGGLHIVNAATGKEESVFVPNEIMDNQYDTLANKDSKSVSGLTGLAYGVDAPWTADNTFKVQTTKSGTSQTTKYVANKINIYGGLRMGGKSIYGLDILDPSSPKLLFNITPTIAGFSRLAQIWSKPVVAEIRVKGVRKKVLIFGGGYDAAAYEKPAGTFTEPALTYGNALYVVDATTGDLIWMSSSDTSGIAGAVKKTANSDLKYSVVGQPVVRDYNADGLVDMIYFADLGGQIFRVDLNNNNQMSTDTDINIAVRVKTIAQLRTTSASGLFVPRFYERLSTAVFDDGQNRFVLVSGGSGNRSFPLEAEKNGKNKIYGLIDRDAAANGLENSTFNTAATITPTMLSNSGVLGKTTTQQIIDSEIERMKLIVGANMLRGWSFELRSVNVGNFAHSFEESQLITGDLYVSLYDAKATLSSVEDTGCGGGVKGISTTHRICMPYGDCAAYVKTSYQGINGPGFGVIDPDQPRTTGLVGPIPETKEYCVGKCSVTHDKLIEQNLANYSQERKIKPVRWFEW